MQKAKKAPTSIFSLAMDGGTNLASIAENHFEELLLIIAEQHFVGHANADRYL